MRISFELGAEFRDGQGKGASRRLRHSGRVPAILYGGHKEPRAITLDHQKLMTLVDNEKFYSSIINLKVGDVTQAAIVKDLQMHPAKNAIVHVDMQRVVETEKIRIHIPIHFKGEAASPGFAPAAAAPSAGAAAPSTGVAAATSAVGSGSSARGG